MVLVCRDYSPSWWRYWGCNSSVSRNCRVFFRHHVASAVFSGGKMMSYTPCILYQNDPRESGNRIISREISLRTLWKKLWSVYEKMWESLFFCYKTGRDIIQLKLVPSPPWLYIPQLPRFQPKNREVMLIFHSIVEFPGLIKKSHFFYLSHMMA